ncbi:MAG: hypothetical protein ACXVB5_17500 [Isosphaeraceae bacterium]
MRWSKPRPENPWPQDMAIRVNDLPHNLILLLFVRQAWSIAPDMDIPPLSPEPDCGQSSLPKSADVATWDHRWRTAWHQAWSWYEIEDPTHHPTPAEMREFSDSSQELNPFIPPFWTQQYGSEGLDQAAYQAWEQRLMPKFPQDAEPRSLQELIPAWKSGMDTIIVLPYKGYFAQRLTRRHLVVSAETRNNPEQYSRALRENTP